MDFPRQEAILYHRSRLSPPFRFRPAGGSSRQSSACHPRLCVFPSVFLDQTRELAPGAWRRQKGLLPAFNIHCFGMSLTSFGKGEWFQQPVYAPHPDPLPEGEGKRLAGAAVLRPEGQGQHPPEQGLQGGGPRCCCWSGRLAQSRRPVYAMHISPPGSFPRRNLIKVSAQSGAVR